MWLFMTEIKQDFDLKLKCKFKQKQLNCQNKFKYKQTCLYIRDKTSEMMQSLVVHSAADLIIQ